MSAKVQWDILTASPFTLQATKGSISPALLGFFGRTGATPNRRLMKFIVLEVSFPLQAALLILPVVTLLLGV